MIGVISLFLMTLPILIVVFVIAIFLKTKEEESFEKKIRAIYMYTIIVISLIMMVSGIIFLFSSGLNIIFPDEYHNLDRSIVAIITSATVILISLPLFIYHNKKVKLD